MENMRYSWMSAGCRSPRGWFASKDIAYADMRRSALDFAQECVMNDSPDEVSMHFSTEQIVAKIGQVERTWEIVEQVARVNYLGEEWLTIDEDEWDRDNEDWWLVTIIPDTDGTFADMWMDNNAGRIVLVRSNGQLLLRYF